jgi:hypothetical protein
MTVSVSIRDAE